MDIDPCGRHRTKFLGVWLTLVHRPCCARRGATTVLCQALITTIHLWTYSHQPPSSCRPIGAPTTQVHWPSFSANHQHFWPPPIRHQPIIIIDQTADKIPAPQLGNLPLSPVWVLSRLYTRLPPYSVLPLVQWVIIPQMRNNHLHQLQVVWLQRAWASGGFRWLTSQRTDCG